MEISEIASKNSLYLGSFEIEAYPNYSDSYDSKWFNFTIFHRRNRVDSYENLEEAVNHIEMQDMFSYVGHNEFALACMPKGFTIDLKITDDVKLDAYVKFKGKFVKSFDQIEQALSYILGEYDD